MIASITGLATLQPWRSSPDVAWVRDGYALYGWGESVRFDPGIGSERFERARAAVRAAPGGVGLAAFTFDEDEPGSVVIVPETLLEVDPAGARLRFGDMSAIPGQREIPALPRGRVAVEDGDAWIVTVAAALGAIGRGEVE